ncbi:unnamed protein product [Merluccius merluccius]
MAQHPPPHPPPPSSFTNGIKKPPTNNNNKLPKQSSFTMELGTALSVHTWQPIPGNPPEEAISPHLPPSGEL